MELRIIGLPGNAQLLMGYGFGNEFFQTISFKVGIVFTLDFGRTGGLAT